MNFKKAVFILFHLFSIAFLFYLIKEEQDPMMEKMVLASAIFMELNLLRILGEKA